MTDGHSATQDQNQAHFMKAPTDSNHSQYQSSVLLPGSCHPTDDSSAIANGESSSSQKLTTEFNGDHLHHRPGGTSTFATVMHIIKGNVGTGILAMPSAFSNAGILVGTVVLAILGVICTHCMHLLVDCAHDLCRRSNKPSLSYSEVAEQAFKLGSPRLSRYSRIAKNTVNVFLMITQFGFCSVYTLFMAQNIQFVVMKFTHNTGEGCDLTKPMPVQLYELCLLIALIPFTFVKNLKILGHFSMLANIMSVFGLLIILYDILINDGLKSVSRLPLFNGWAKLPVYFGTAMFAFEGISVILPVENKMRNPRALPPLFGALDVGMTIVCVMYLTLGFYGYIEYGSAAQGSITLNLGQWYGVVVQLTFVFCLFVSYGLQFYVMIEIVGSSFENTRLAQRMGPKISNYLLRAVLVIAAFGVAASVDRYLNLLISLIGALASTALAIIFPPILEIVTTWPHRDTQKYFKVTCVKNTLIFFLGIVGFVSGTVVTVVQLVKQLGGDGDTNACPSPLFDT